MRYDAELARLNARMEQVWGLVRDANVHEARTESEKIVSTLQDNIEEKGKNEKRVLQSLTHAYHLAGYTASMNTRDRDALLSAHYFEKMRSLASSLPDDPLLIIALTYKGDAHRRKGDLPRAMKYLQTAYTREPHTDRAALGNCTQLLARVYALLEDEENFQKMMIQAEEIAREIHPIKNSLHGQYCLGTVYIDYARYYSKQGQTRKALDYLEQADRALPETMQWRTLLTATFGIVLVKGGDISTGMPYVMKAVKLAREHGYERLQDNFYALERFLSQRTVEISKAKVQLSDTLDKHLAF